MAILPENLTRAQGMTAQLDTLFKHYAALKSDEKFAFYTSVGYVQDHIAYDDATSIREIVLDSLRLAIECKIDDLAYLGVNVEAYSKRSPEIRIDELAAISVAYGGCVETRDIREAIATQTAEDAAASVVAASFATSVGG